MSKKIVVIIALSFGVRWQAQRDTALDYLACNEPKRRRRYALPAHSKLLPAVIRRMTRLHRHESSTTRRADFIACDQFAFNNRAILS